MMVTMIVNIFNCDVPSTRVCLLSERLMSVGCDTIMVLLKYWKEKLYVD